MTGTSEVFGWVTCDLCMIVVTGNYRVTKVIFSTIFGNTNRV